MKINVHDKFKSWRQFVSVVKELHRFLDKHNLELRTITAYISVENKDTHKLTSLYVNNEEEQYSEEIGIDIGYFEWDEIKHDGMLLKCKCESDLLSQSEYTAERYHYQAEQRRLERETQLAAESKDFAERYLPVRSLTKKSGVKKSDFNTVKQLTSYGYDWKKVQKAIDEGKCYKECRWKSIKNK